MGKSQAEWRSELYTWVSNRISRIGVERQRISDHDDLVRESTTIQIHGLRSRIVNVSPSDQSNANILNKAEIQDPSREEANARSIAARKVEGVSSSLAGRKRFDRS